MKSSVSRIYTQKVGQPLLWYVEELKHFLPVAKFHASFGSVVLSLDRKSLRDDSPRPTTTSYSSKHNFDVYMTYAYKSNDFWQGKIPAASRGHYG